jgi:hypothetical protein
MPAPTGEIVKRSNGESRGLCFRVARLSQFDDD